jgi:hypothetical protein
VKTRNKAPRRILSVLLVLLLLLPMGSTAGSAESEKAPAAGLIAAVLPAAAAKTT